MDGLRTSTTILLVLSAIGVASKSNAASIPGTAQDALIEAVQADDSASVARILATHPNVNRQQDDLARYGCVVSGAVTI